MVVAALTGAALVGGGSSAWAEALVDLNTATAEELTSLPGIGPAKARAIMERRDEEPFESTEDLVEVPGIGEALLERLRDHIEVGEDDTRKERRSRS